MPKVKMKCATNWRGPVKPGDEVEVDDETAERWQKHGIAEIIEHSRGKGKKAVEAAME